MPTSPTAKSGLSRGLERAVVALAFLTVFCAAFHTLIDTDIWFHLRAGMEIARGSIPRVDSFSYPSAGRPYVDLHWLFQLLVYLLYRLAGEPALIWFAGACVTATYFVLFRLARREAPAPLAAALIAFGAVVASERFSPRPELLSFLFLALIQWCVRRHQEGWRRAWWIIPAIVLVWVNSEGLFILGFAPLAAAILDQPRDRRIWKAVGLSALACLINPYFVHGALHPLILFTRINRSMPIYSATIGEFLSPFAGRELHPGVALFPYYLGLIGLALLACGRWPRRGEILLMAGFVYLGCSARRNVALLPLVATPMVARWIAGGTGLRVLARRWENLPEPRRRLGLAAALCGALLALAGYDLGIVTNRIYVRAETNREFGSGRAEADFARGAGRFLKEQKVEGPVFTSFTAGSYLSFAYPQEREFIDGRLEVHSTEHYARYLRLLQGGPYWVEAEKAYGFNAAVIQYMDAMLLTLDRLRDPSWCLVYLDDTAVVLLKRNDRNRRIIERCAITPSALHARFPAVGLAQIDSSFTIPAAPSRSPLRCLRRERFPWSQMDLAQFFYSINRFDLALAQFLEAVRLDPEQPGPRLLLATTLNQIGRPQVAYQALLSAERLGGNADIRQRDWITRGDILNALDRPQEAVASYTRYLSHPTFPGQTPVVLASRGLARLRAGDPEGAEADLLESLRAQPNNAQAYWYLGQVEEARNRPAEARKAYEAFKALGGRSPEVDLALRRLGSS